MASENMNVKKSEIIIQTAFLTVQKVCFLCLNQVHRTMFDPIYSSQKPALQLGAGKHNSLNHVVTQKTALKQFMCFCHAGEAKTPVSP